jgi:hypothetical protein
MEDVRQPCFDRKCHVGARPKLPGRYICRSGQVSGSRNQDALRRCHFLFSTVPQATAPRCVTGTHDQVLGPTGKDGSTPLRSVIAPAGAE